MLNVLFVCSSNFVRSPIAEGCFRQVVQQAGLDTRIAVDSAGAYSGATPRAPHRIAQTLCAQNGIDISGKLSREVAPDAIAAADYLFALDEDSFWFVRTIAPDYPQKRLKLFLELSGQSAIRDVPDPVLGHGTFEETFQLIVQTLPGILALIRKNEGI